MIKKTELIPIIEGVLAESPVFMTDVDITKDNDITIYIEKDQGEIDIDDCVEISRQVEAALDRDAEDFSLTVSSAGLDRPFSVNRQYVKFTGKEITVILKTGEKFRCTISKVNESSVEVKYEAMVPVEGKKRKVRTVLEKELAFDQIKSATPYISFR